MHYVDPNKTQKNHLSEIKKKSSSTWCGYFFNSRDVDPIYFYVIFNFSNFYWKYENMIVLLLSFQIFFMESYKYLSILWDPFIHKRKCQNIAFENENAKNIFF